MDTLFFVLSKTLWIVLKPETMFGFLLLGAIVAVRRNRQGIALGILAAALISFVSLAIVPLGDVFLEPLEHRIPARSPVAKPAYIVVLGGAEANEQSAATGTVNVNDAGERLLAAIELAVAYPEAKLILSGGSGRLAGGTLSSAELMAEALTAAGIESDRLLLEEASRNTSENAARSAELVGTGVSAPALLVTSAFHMPRSVGVFCAAGWSDITPFPVDYRTGNIANRIGWQFAINLNNLNVGVREWIGLIAYRLTGRTREFLPRAC
ncbi:YdcF family protein [uncultured Hoeflea sp.]|uniref:YdcF family protein n=1 Tax=uncultured Hoeflea sp. TaxID=538666 RepID=UPI00262BDDE3|nr:YdcF family protein [uncultured Hoeflea sp.]